MSQFRWNLLILDDEKARIEMTANYLQTVGFNVNVLDDPAGFKEECFKLSQSHIAFIDMKWPSFLKRRSQFRHLPIASQLDELVQSNPVKLVETWVEVVRDWTSGASSNPSDKPGIIQGKLPRSFIPQNQVGVWFGGMLSWVAPNATLLFFSSDNEAVQQEFAPALTVFRRRPFYVYPKATTNPTSLIILSDLLPYLFPKQKALLLRREVRSWFIKDVLLRVLGGKNTQVGQVGIPVSVNADTQGGKVSGRIIRFDLEAQYFFPGIKELNTSKDQILFYRRFLDDPSFSREEYIALWQFIHDARHYPEDPGRLPKMLDSLEAAGIWGHEAANRLRSHIVSKLNCVDSDDSTVKMSIALVEAVMFDAANYLTHVCSQLGESASFIDHVKIVEDRPIAPSHDTVFEPYGGKVRGIRFLRFPPSWIASILQPLKDNAVKHNCSWIVRISADSESLRVLFASQWNSNSKLDGNGFWDCAASSSGDDGRGLPLAIPRILETNPDQCLIKTGEEIFDIWGNAAANFSSLGTPEWNFVIEVSYRFHKTTIE